MTLLESAPLNRSSITRGPFAGRTRWSAGFGPADAPYLANVEGVSFRTARRRLLRCLELYRDVLAMSARERTAFDGAVHELMATPLGGAWSTTISTAAGTTTFWILGAAAANAAGARLKR